MGWLHRAAFGSTALIAIALPAEATAQRADTVKVTVQVRNPLGLGVPLADVAARTVNGTIVVRTQADSEGQAVLTFLRSSNAVQLFVRRLGYKPQAQPLPYPLEGSNSVVALLADDEPAVLDTVRTNSRESIRRRTYFIDSAAITRSPVLVRDGWEILKKLRPDIAYGRDPVDYCPGVEEVFVNGEWVVPETVLINEMVAMREPGGTSRTAPHLNAHRTPTTSDRVAAMNALSLIKPEHIAQITFRDCRDKPIAGMHSTSAVFVVLKDGIAFDPAVGSFPIRP